MPTEGGTPAKQHRTLFGQASRFVVVGLLAAAVDLSVYQSALHLGLWIHAARALSFVCGTTAAYVLNRRWAFDAPGGIQQATGFALLYATTFFLILGVNALALHVLPAAWWAVTAAWAVSQGVGTIWNFAMLRTVVFRPPRRA